MLSINRIYFYIFIYMLLIQIPSIILITFLDELGIAFLTGLICLDLLVNCKFKKYMCLYIIEGILAFYALYSMIILNFNTVPAILNDYVLQMKPFIPFCITYAIAPEFTNPMKSVVKVVCIIIPITLFIIYITGTIYITISHPAFLGIISFNCSLIYLYCSIKNDGSMCLKDFLIVIAILLIGLTSTRSKFYGEFVITLYFLLFYKPGVLKRINVKQITLFSAAIIIMLIVTWNKIEYYFIMGNSDTFDSDALQAYARPVLYATMLLILQDYPLLGSGLASFATYSSGPDINYSLIYFKYGIDKVWGLSEQMPDFICDAFYPELAQFGLIGIMLFIFFFVWIYQKLRLLLYLNGKWQYVIGLLVITFIIIESIAGTVIVQAGGMIAMMILGMIVAKYKHISNEKARLIFKHNYSDTQEIKRIINENI